MSNHDHPLSQEEFDTIYAKVPRLTVEAVIRTPDGIVMTRIPKGVAKGQWNVPGGTVRFKETVVDAVRRVAKNEIGVDVIVGSLIGYIEYPHLNESGYNGWPVGLAFEVEIKNGDLTVSNYGEEVKCFTTPPNNTIPEQAEFLAEYLKKKSYTT
jgi:ADP-ribose pyrophosphatase YjhB (NUDIX family)